MAFPLLTWLMRRARPDLEVTSANRTGCHEEDAGRRGARLAGAEEQRAVPARALLRQHAPGRRPDQGCPTAARG
eukprot:7229560-Alexandrium_andersonii.AAC.1